MIPLVVYNTLTYATQDIPICLLSESLPLRDVELSGYTKSAVKFGTAVTFPCL